MEVDRDSLSEFYELVKAPREQLMHDTSVCCAGTRHLYWEFQAGWTCWVKIIILFFLYGFLLTTMGQTDKGYYSSFFLSAKNEHKQAFHTRKKLQCSALCIPIKRIVFRQ